MTISPSIPVVHFEQWREPTQRAMFVQTVGEALRDVGFFALEGHGIPSELIRDAYGTIQSFLNCQIRSSGAMKILSLRGNGVLLPLGANMPKTMRCLT